MSLKTKLTSKLYYKRWLYKVVVTCGGINHLHRKGIEYVRDTVPSKSYMAWHSPHYTQTIFSHKAELLEIGVFLEAALVDKEYKIRAEGDAISIFTNDIALVNLIKRGLKTFVTEVWEPASSEHATYLLSNKAKIICDELPHETYRFKIYFKNGASPPKQFMDNFLAWAKKFDDGRIYIPKGTERILDGSTFNYFYGQYFYAKDSKMTSMALMFMGDYMNKTEEYVLKSEIA